MVPATCIFNCLVDIFINFWKIEEEKKFLTVSIGTVRFPLIECNGVAGTNNLPLESYMPRFNYKNLNKALYYESKVLTSNCSSIIHGVDSVKELYRKVT